MPETNFYLFHDLLIWLSKEFPRIQKQIQDTPDLAATVSKSISKYHPNLVKQGFISASRVAVILYKQEIDLPCSYEKFVVGILDDQCRKLTLAYKVKDLSFFGSDYIPSAIESVLDDANGILGLPLLN